MSSFVPRRPLQSGDPILDRLIRDVIMAEDILAFPMIGTETDTGTDGGGGGGAGTVTDVAGGVGLTASPEPIVGSGTVDLDIASLASLATPASGDLLAIVDVSGGGTNIANQRSITYDDLVAPVLAVTQPLDADLTALAGFGVGTGIAVRTAADTWALRQLAAGEGISITDPDASAGDPIVDLWINTLTTETALAADDLFPFQDVSVGTGVGHQRKVTLDNMRLGLAALNSSDPWAGYLLLAGRAGAANDPIISTGATGNVYGSSAANGLLVLNGTSHATKTTARTDVANKMRVASGVSSIGSTAGGYNAIDALPGPLSITALVILRALNFNPTITYSDDSQGLQLFRANPTHVPSGAARTMNFHTYFQSSPAYSPGAVGLADLSLRSLVHNPTLNADTGAGSNALIVYGLQSQGSLNSGWDVDDYAAVKMDTPNGSGATVARLGAVQVDDLGSYGATDVYSMWSKGADVPLCHGGRAIFGVSQSSLTTPQATVDVGGDLATRRQDMALVNGANDDMTRTGTYIRLTGGGAAPPTLSGLTAGADGLLVCLFNDTGNNVTIVHNATSAAANQFNTVTAANKTLADQRCMFFFYETAAGKWVEMMPQ